MLRIGPEKTVKVPEGIICFQLGFIVFIYNKIRVIFQKCVDDILVFFGFGAANGVYDNTAGLDEARCRL